MARLLFVAALALLAVLAVPARGQAGEGFTQELASLPFESIIGGPFRAVVDAQGLAATKTVEFVTAVGFSQATDGNGDPTGNREVVMVEFLYEARLGNSSDVIVQKMQIPFLTLMPIPYITVDRLVIDFNVQLQSTQTNTASTSSLYAHTSTGSRGFWSRTNWRASYSSQRQRKTTGEEKRSYKLNIRVEAGQAGLPAGAERMLDLMESLATANLPVDA